MQYGTSINSLVVSGTNLFAGSNNGQGVLFEGGGVFLSIDNGESWSAVNSGLTDTIVLSLVVSGTNLFAGTYSGVFRSTNNGTSWTPINSGLPTKKSVIVIAFNGTNIFVGTYSGLFRSTNNGESWSAVDSGLTATSVGSFIVSGTNLFAGTNSGVFRSTNNGTNWTAVNSGLTYPIVTSLAVCGMNLFAAANIGNPYGPCGVFLSTNNGTNWITVYSSGFPDLIVNPFAVSGTNLFAGTGDIKNSHGVLLSTNNGVSWTEVGLKNYPIWSLAVSGMNLFAGTYGQGVWRRPLSEMTSVEQTSAQLPDRFTLQQNYLNPFNPSTTILFSIAQAGAVSLTVYDMLGREAETLVNEYREHGTYTSTFSARSLSSGVYMYRLRSGSSIETKRMVLMK